MSRKYQERDKPTFQLADFMVEGSQKQGSRGKPKSQEVCSFYAQGKFCKFGNDCKFSHSNPSETKPEANNDNSNGSSKKSAAATLQIKPSLPRERGRIFILNEEKGYGFVIPSTGGKKLWFHFSDIEDEVILKEKDEVEFSVVRDKLRADDLKAINIKLIGRVNINNNDQKEEQQKTESKDEEPKFMPAWMKTTNNDAKTSDKQSPAKLAPAKPKSIFAKDDAPIFLGPQTPKLNIKPKSSPNKMEQMRKGTENLVRQTGVVQQVKDKFGFIKCPGYSEPIFYHMNECEDDTPFNEGDEVDFFVVPDARTSGNLKATCVRMLRSGSFFSDRFTLDDDFDLPAESKSNANGQNQGRHLEKWQILDWLGQVSKIDGEMLLLHTSMLDQVANQDELPFTVIQPLLVLLTQVSLRNSDRTDKIYQIVLESKFLTHPRNLRSYILKLAEARRPAKELCTDFEAVVTLLQEITDRLHNISLTNLPLDALNSAAQKLYGMKILKEDIMNNVQHLMEVRDRKKAAVAKHFNANEWIPDGFDEDFRDISVFPSTHEILGIESGQLSDKIRPNIVDGKYKNVMHYLDTHFRLLREDCIQPLREGIKSYVASKKGTQAVSRDIRVYHDVAMRGIQCGRNGIVYRVSFKLDCEVAWERSKRLMYGSLLCLSCDDFNTLLWATVANRDVSLLQNSSQIDIRFPSGYEGQFSPESVYTMVESATTYFEAYQHVLKALQGLDIDKFSFADYLISCNPAVKAPSYLKPKHDCYDFSNVFDGGKRSFNMLDKWPLDEVESTLDNSQMAALKQSLTKELAIVQGPPGTGKTFVGLKVMRALLDNRTLRKEKPILVICYTNHALDQFLEGVLTFEDSVVRIGGRSKSDVLKEKNIRKLIYEAGKTGKQHHRSRFDINQQLDQLHDQIQQCIYELNKQQELAFGQVRKVATNEQTQSLLNGKSKDSNNAKPNGDEMLKFWLSEIQQAKKGKAKTKANGNSNGTSKNTKQAKPAAAADPDADDLTDDEEAIVEMQDERMVGEDVFDAGNEDRVFQLKDNVVMDKKNIKISDKILQAKDVWSLNAEERQQLYRYWIAEFFRRDSSAKDDTLLSELCRRYDELCQEKRVLEEELQIEVMAKAAVIGVTTTGVAKFQKMFQSVQPEVIIVEEAAEVLEAHIIAALSPSTKHLILIGDHEQLRPSTAVYRLSTQYHLDVSLFERLVRNGLEQVTLLKQRRMRPAISSLIDSIYPGLENHERVHSYPNVLGVSNNVFFLHHTNPESNNADSCSKSNEQEAYFIARFCNYLLLQGYKPEQITVLSAYSGQVHLVRKECRKFNITAVRITSVDNYQGEENDIIILSLVRNNTTGEIGFLKASNRVCVALSRAKHGLFITGNANLLSKKNELWANVIAKLKEQGSIGNQLKLQCQNHPTKFTMVAKDADFNHVEDGGCNQYCKQTLPCGHVCPRFCHPYPHEQLECHKPCMRKHPTCNHPCNKRCFEPCGSCDIVVDKTLPCGHQDKVPCGLPADEHMCSKPCERKMPCKLHKCPKLCGERCGQFCHEIVEKDLKCGHVAKVECGADTTRFKCPTCNQLLVSLLEEDNDVTPSA